MTVEELIKELESYPRDMKIVIEQDGNRKQVFFNSSFRVQEIFIFDACILSITPYGTWSEKNKKGVRI